MPLIAIATMNKKNIFAVLHRWIGLTAGAIVFILGLTGCILAFADEIKALTYRHKVEVEIGKHPLPYSQLFAIAQGYWGAEKQVSALELSNDPANAWHFRAFKENVKRGLWYWEEKEYYESVYIDPYSGKIIDHENAEFEFFRIILYLHWSLLLHTEIGQPIVGTATVLYVLLLLTGLYLWWPKNKKARRKRLSFLWKPGTGRKRKNYDLHNILGFYMLSIGLIIALTGILWAFPSLGKNVVALLNSEETEIKTLTKASTVNDSTYKFQPYDRILADLKNNYPEAQGFAFYFPKDQKASHTTAVVRFKKAYQAVIRVYNGQTGDLIQTDAFEQKTRGEKFREIIYDLHVGSILGLPGKILAFSASLISASLPLTGFLIWYNRKRKRRKRSSALQSS